MLVLTRRIGEKLIIGDDIEVIILDSTTTSAKVGVKAPPNIRVDRLEVRQRPDFCPLRKGKAQWR